MSAMMCTWQVCVLAFLLRLGLASEHASLISPNKLTGRESLSYNPRSLNQSHARSWVERKSQRPSRDPRLYAVCTIRTGTLRSNKEQASFSPSSGLSLRVCCFCCFSVWEGTSFAHRLHYDQPVRFTAIFQTKQDQPQNTAPNHSGSLSLNGLVWS